MNLQEITVFIEPNGEVRLELNGFAGGACLEATKALEQALGGQILSREMKAESWESKAGEAAGEQQSTGS